MTNEVASLGVKVDSSGIESGVKALDALAKQGPKIEQAMAGVEGAAVKTGKSLKTMGDGSAKGLDDVSKAAPKAAEGLGRIAKSAEDATRALAGINASVSSLGQITTAAGQSARGMAGFDASLKASQKSLADMQAQIRVASTAVTQMGSVLTAAVPSMQAAAKAQADAAKSAVDMGAAFKAASDQVRSYSTVAVSASDAGQKAAKSMETTATAARTITSALAIAGVGFGAQELIGLVDGYGKVTAQLRLATNGASDYAAAMESVRQISRSAQQGLGEVGTLYARIANGTAELGISQRRLSDITEVVALSLRASNATASEASSAMLQLSQAFASGVLRGEEFNAVNEAAPRLMKALADGIGQPIGALRKLAEEGKLTSEVLATALPKALEEVRVEAAKMQTIGGSFTVLKNSMMEFLGTTAQSSGAVTAITKSVELLADNLNLVTAAAIGFGATKLAQSLADVGSRALENSSKTAAYVVALNQQRAASIAVAEAEAATSAARVSGLATLQARLTAERQAAITEAAAATSSAARTQALMAASVAELNLTRTTTQLTAATAAQTAAQAALSGAITATSTAATVASRALSLAGGPVGLITTALGLGVTAWMAWGSSAESASAQARNAIVSGHQDIMSRLDEQIRKLRDRAGLLAAGNVAAARDAGPEAEELARLNTRIEALKSQGASLAGADQIVLIELQRQYGNLNASLEARKKLQEEINGLGVQDRLNAIKMEEGGFKNGWLEKLKTYEDALAAGAMSASEYAEAVTRLNKKRYESSEAGRAEAKALKAGAGEAKAAEHSYQGLLKSVNEHIAAVQLQMNGSTKLTESQKLQVKYDELLMHGKKGASAATIAMVQAQISALAVLEREQKAIRLNVAAYQDYVTQQQELADDYVKQSKAREMVWKSISAGNVALDDQEKRLSIEEQMIGRSSAARTIALAQLEAEIELRKELSEIDSNLDIDEPTRIEARAAARARSARKIALAERKAYVAEWEKTSQLVGQTLADYIMGGGKDAAQYLKRLFATLVLQPVVQYGVSQVMGGLGMGGAGGTGSSIGGMFDLFSKGKSITSIFGGTSMANTVGAGYANLTGTGIDGLLATNGAYGTAGGVSGAAGSAFSSVLSFAPYAALIAAGMNMAGNAYDQGYRLNQKDYTKGWLATGGIAPPTLNLDTKILEKLGISGKVANMITGASLWAKGMEKLGLTTRGANHQGGAYSTTGNGVYDLGLRGDALGDFTSRGNAEIASSVQGLVQSTVSAFDYLGKYANDTFKGVDIAAGFAVNGRFKSEDAYAYFKLIDKASGAELSSYTQRDGGLGSDVNAAWGKFSADLLGQTLEQFKKADITGWVRDELSAIDGEVTLENLAAAALKIAVIDAQFADWGNTLTGFANLSGAAQTALLQVSGGLESLAGNVNIFYSSFYSEQERMEILQKQLRDAMGGLQLSIDPAMGEAAKEQFRAAVEGALAAGNGELAAQLLALGQGFATASDYAQKSLDQLAQAQAQLRAQLRSSLIDLEAGFSGGGFSRQYRAQDLASQVQGMFAGIGIVKDAGLLAEQIMAATSAEVEDYFRSMWEMLGSDEARLQLIGVTDALMDLAQASAAAAADTERLSLEQRWLQATGNTAELRRRELEALDPSNRALLEMIYGLEDAKARMSDLANAATAAAQNAAAAWQNWGTAAGLGATHLGDTSGLEARQAILGAQITASADPAQRLAKLQELISVEQAIGQAQQASRKTELEAITARQSALQKEVSTAQQLLSAAQSLGDYVLNLRLGEASGLSDADRLNALGSEYSSLLGAARGGDVEAYAKLQSVSGDYLGLAREISVSNADYSVLSGRMAAELETVAALGQASATSSLQQYQDQIAQLQAQTDLLATAAELSESTKSLIAKSMLDQADVWDRENSQALTLQELQQRAVDSLALMPAGIASAIKPSIDSSAAYLANSLGSTVSSALNSLAGMLGMDGSHATGLSYVPFDGYRAELHRGERVLTAEENRAYSLPRWFVMQQDGQANAELLTEVRALRAEVAALKRPMEQTAAATTQLGEQFDNATAGGNGMAVNIMEQAAPLQVKEVA